MKLKRFFRKKESQTDLKTSQNPKPTQSQERPERFGVSGARIAYYTESQMESIRRAQRRAIEYYGLVQRPNGSWGRKEG